MKRNLVGILLLASAASTAQATILYGNLGDPFTTNSQLTESLYQSFSTGSSSLQLDDLKLVLDVKGPDSGSFTVGLYSDNSTKPGTLLLSIATVNDSSLTMTASTYDFSVANYSLAANTRYWIGLIPTPSSIQGSWESSNPQGGDTGVSGQYTDFGGIVFPVGPTTSPGFQMSIDAIAPTPPGAPEPASALLLAAGLVAVCWRGRRAD
jgi:hypothetical protein